MKRRALAAAAVAWLGVVGYLTLRSDPAMREIVLTTPWYCLVCGVGGATDVLLNIILFAPFGIVARSAGWSFPRLLIIAFLLTLSIELIQGNFLIGRDATLGDVLANSGGAALGWVLVAGLGSLIAVPRRARAAALAVLTCQGMLWVGTGLGMRPSLDGPAPWVGRFRKVGNGQDPFEGTLQRVVLDSIPVTMESMSRLPAKEDSLTLGIDLTRSTALPPRRSASIVRLVDATPRAFLRVSQVQQGITVEVRMPASGLRFRTPSWRFSTALEIPVGQPWQFQWRWHAASVEMMSGSADGATAPVHTSRAMSIGLGWALVHPFVYSIDEHADRWTALWLAGWFALLGWSAGLGGRRFALAIGLAGVMVFVLAGAAISLPVTLPEVAATLAGFAIGWLIAHVATPRPTAVERGASPAGTSIRTG